jgi:hypothetical protein
MQPRNHFFFILIIQLILLIIIFSPLLYSQKISLSRKELASISSQNDCLTYSLKSPKLSLINFYLPPPNLTLRLSLNPYLNLLLSLLAINNLSLNSSKNNLKISTPLYSKQSLQTSTYPLSTLSPTKYPIYLEYIYKLNEA